MRCIFTICLSVVFFSANSQTQLAQIFHGCSGATVTAYPSDPAWSNVTYNFQRFEGSNWVTVHSNTNNWHLITPGDISAPANYRAIIHNNTTNEDRVTNGVTANPALFFNTVLAPNPQVTMYWGGDNNAGVNYAEVLPHPFGANSRPPYTFEYKKATDAFWQNRIATTGIFVMPIEANTRYEFRVTDVCGQTSNIMPAELVSQVVSPITTVNCSGGTIQVGVSSNGSSFSQRSPFTFAAALLPPGTPTNPVPDAILNSLNYVYTGNEIAGLPLGQYVIRGRDRFGVLANYIIRNVAVTVNPPQFVSTSLGSSYCFRNINIQPTIFSKGIRIVGSNQPYTFSTGPTFVDVPVGNLYEMVLQDTCGRISNPIQITISPLAPRINSTPVTGSSCKYTITVNADVCNTAEYGIKPIGSSTISWQSSNVFGNLPMTGDCDSIFVKDLTTGLITRTEVCKPSLVTNAIPQRETPDCNSLYYVQLYPVLGAPPYSYSISYDGINFSAPGTSNTFSGLQPGTYTFRATDACGLSSETSLSTLEMGSVFYLKESGVNTNCSNGDTLGGYLKFGLRLFDDDDILSPPPYHFEIKEVVSANGNNVIYGKTVYTGQSTDTIISIKGLESSKEYGFFITNACGQIFTSANRVLNAFAIPAFVAPEPIVTVDASNCASPFIAITGFPTTAIARIYAGEGTTGNLQSMFNDSISNALAGGFYTIKLTSSNINGCYWEKTETVFVNSDDSTRTGVFDATVSSGFCSGISTPISLHQNIKNETPGGDWSADPVLTWSNQALGEFIPADQAPGTYRITYLVTSLCGVNRFVEFEISIGADYCRLTMPGDYESAKSSSGCKTYSGNQWQHVFNNTGDLVYSINAGSGNTIQSTCWGVRSLVTVGNPRSTTINGSTVYFAPRNFYIEPSVSTIANPPVRVRLYYQSDELNLLLNYMRQNGFPSATINDLRILKKQAGPGSPVNLDIVNDPGTPSSLYTVITPVAVPFGQNGAYYFEFEINSFSEFAIVFANNFSLPVTWLSVSGKLQDNSAIIEWSTASESNSSHFEIEHSSNTNSFVKVGTIKAMSNSNVVSKYSFTHHSPTVGKNLYRIRQVDNDGKFTYSKVIMLLNSKNDVSIVVSPNPARDFLQLNFSNTNSGRVSIYGMDGKLVLQQSVAVGNQQRIIDISKLPSGMYSLQLQTNELVKTTSFIKH